jgi:serine/threonine protein phosphatase 1
VCKAVATIAIGDIHGHLAALEDLLAKVQPTLSRSDVLVFLGDYIDKGPDVRGCLDRIIAMREEAPCPVVGLLGNHDQAMLRTWKDPTSHSWIFMGGFETIESYSAKAAAAIQAEFEAAGPRLVLEKVRVGYERFFQEMPATHLAFFEGLSLYHETADVVCVHAGVGPQGSPNHLQDPEVFTWGAGGFPDEYRGTQAIVYGHWENSVEDEAGWPWPCILSNRTFGIDTISKGVLTAMRFPDGAIFQSEKRDAGFR